MDSVLSAEDYIDASEGATGLVAAALVVAWDQPELMGDDTAYAPDPWPRQPGPLPEHLRVKGSLRDGPHAQRGIERTSRAME